MATIIKGKNPRRPYTVRYQHDGRQREKSFATQKEAKDFRAKFEHDSRLNVFVDPRNGSVPFAEYARTWVAGLDRAEGTKSNYRSVIDRHLAPALAGRSLAQVAQDREAVTDLLTSMRENGVSASRCGMVRSVINGAMAEAVQAGRISTHRLKGITVREDAVRPAEITVATKAQLEKLAAGLRPELALTVWLMAGCGLRISECLAVRLDGFRDGGKVLRVSEQVARGGRGTVPLKARRAGEYRDVPVPVWVWEKVQEHAQTFGSTGYLFLRPDGLHVLYRSYHDRFAASAGKAGLKGFTEHGLRHLYASKLLTSGVPITEVSKWLGHRDINVTHQIYSHLIPSSWDRAREALETLAA